MEARVVPVQTEQRLVRPLLDEAPLVDDQDAMGGPKRAGALGRPPTPLFLDDS